MDFKKATTAAIKTCITLEDIGKACGLAHHSVRRARLKVGTPSYRSVPDGWQPEVARLARERAARLLKLADDLERGTSHG